MKSRYAKCQTLNFMQKYQKSLLKKILSSKPILGRYMQDIARISGYQIACGWDVKKKKICNIWTKIKGCDSFIWGHDSLGDRKAKWMSLLCFLNGYDTISFLWSKFSGIFFWLWIIMLVFFFFYYHDKSSGIKQ